MEKQRYRDCDTDGSGAVGPGLRVETNTGSRRASRASLNMALAALLAGAVGVFANRAPAAGISTSRYIQESAREIPLAYDVDVLVVGGSSAGVAAAVSAAEAGASVFLAAEQKYLGDDIAGTLRLALEDGEDPYVHDLAARIWGTVSERKQWPFTYSASEPSTGVHRDTDPPSRLANGLFERASQHSVQYSGPVNITVDLGESRHVWGATLMAFRRKGDFDVGQAELWGSQDGKEWEKLGVLSNHKPYRRDQAHPYAAEVGAAFRYLRFDVLPSDSLNRVLLGELIIEAGEKKPAETRVPTPLQVKHILDQALLQAGVEFLFGSYPSDVLVGADGQLAGAVIVNRAGRQAIRAKTVIDATSRGALARLLGAEFSSYPAGTHRFSLNVIAGDTNEGPEIEKLVRQPAPDWDPDLIETFKPDGTEYPVGPPPGFDQMFHEYTLAVSLDGGDFVSLAHAEQQVRDLTWNLSQIESADLLFQVPPDRMKGVVTLEEWVGADEFDLDALRTPVSAHFFLLNGCVSAERAVAEQLLRPVSFMQVGDRVGRTAAALAAAEPRSAAPVRVKPREAADAEPFGEVRERLSGVRYVEPWNQKPVTVSSEGTVLPVLGTFDVVVVGGGTAGAPAAIAAAREGATTLLLERFHGLGGISTLGRIGVYCFGHRIGFTRELDDSLRAQGEDAIRRTARNWPAWNNQWKQEWYRSEFNQRGGTLWFGASGVGALTDGETVKGVVVATPEGRGIVLADAVVDATGNSDIAAAAGARTVFVDADNDALQGTGLSVTSPYPVSRGIHPDYANTDYTFMDESDMVDTWRTHVGGRDKWRDQFDLASLANTRERRRIIGEFKIMPTDILAERTYPDTIALAFSNFDTHGFTIHPVWYIKQPDEGQQMFDANVPYRSLIPEAVDGILVCGLGMSAHRDAMPVLRMQPDVQNAGYAAGLAAALAVRDGVAPRHVDVRELQHRLVAMEIVPETALTDEEMLPLSDRELAQALESPLRDHKTLSLVLMGGPGVLPVLRQQYAEMDDPEQRTAYAIMLGIMGDDTAVEHLLEEVARRPWDEGWNFRGGGQFGGNMSELDRLILALAYTGDPRAVPLLSDKMDALDADQEFSHFRAVAMAAESVAAESLAAESLAAGLFRLLQLEGVQGWHITREDIYEASSPAYFTDRSLSLREIFLARGLYACGDYNGQAYKILNRYANDVRGYYSQMARSILKGGKAP